MTIGPQLSIDFGTSNTVGVVAWPGGRAKPLLFDGSPLLPSAVYAEEPGSAQRPETVAPQGGAAPRNTRAWPWSSPTPATRSAS